MFKLFGFEYGGSTFEIFGSKWSGLERLVVNGEEVARKRNFHFTSTYEFTIKELGALALSFRMQMIARKVSYELRRDGVSVLSDSVPMHIPDGCRRPPSSPSQNPRAIPSSQYRRAVTRWFGWGSPPRFCRAAKRSRSPWPASRFPAGPCSTVCRSPWR
jgi:hypothetical protein